MLIVDFHIIHGDISFSRFWEEDKSDDCNLLFISYIIDERMFSFGDRWMSEAQVKSIKQWESKNNLSSLLSNNYGACLTFSIENKWVYPSDYTSYVNPREYKLHNSVKRLLTGDSATFLSKLKLLKRIILKIYRFDGFWFFLASDNTLTFGERNCIAHNKDMKTEEAIWQVLSITITILTT